MSFTAFDGLLADWRDLDGQKLRFQLLFFTQFVAFSGFAVFRNVYLEEMGMSGSAMGQIGFLMTATGVVAQPLWGMLTDYWQAERGVLILGASVSAVGLLAYPVGEGLATPFLIVALGTAVYSAFRAPIVPIANGLILSRGYNYGNIRAYGSIAFGIGSLGFGFLVAALGISSVVYFYVAGMVVLVLVIWSIPPSEDADEDDEDDEAPMSEAIRALVTNTDFLVVMAVAFILGISMRGSGAFFSVYMRAIDASVVLGPWSLSADALTGIAWSIKTMFEAVAFLYAARLSGSYKAFLVVGGIAVTLPNLVYGFVAQPWAILGVQVAGGIGYGLYYLAAVNLVYVVAQDRVTSTAQTVLMGAGLGLGGAVGQIVAGELVDYIGIQQMYVYIAAIGFTGALIGLLVRQKGAVGEESLAT